MNLRRNWLQFGRGSQFEQQNSPILFFCAVDTLSQIISIVSYQLWLYPESCFSFSYELHKVSASIGHIHDSCCLPAIMTQASLWFKCGNCSRSYKALEKASVVHTNAPEEDRQTKSKEGPRKLAIPAQLPANLDAFGWFEDVSTGSVGQGLQSNKPWPSEPFTQKHHINPNS